MTRSTAAHLRRARQAIAEHGRREGRQAALDELDNIAHREPLLQQLAARNFDDIAALLRAGRRLAAVSGETAPACTAAAPVDRRRTPRLVRMLRTAENERSVSSASSRSDRAAS